MTDTGSQTSSIELHGHQLSYTDVGSGPAVLFIHGLLGSRQTWAPVIRTLTAEYRLLAPDLFGHGESAKPIGDYSLGSHAATLRDLLDKLGIERVSLVGHSLGGGIAMQFCYLFPERVDRLVLVSSGGLGRELNLMLRAATLPGAELVIPVIASRWVRERVTDVGSGLRRLGLHRLPLRRVGLGRLDVLASPDAAEAWRGFTSLGDAESRRAFLASTRAVVDPGGQTVTARDHLPGAATVPALLIWGAKDRIIPSWHAVTAQQDFPGSRVEIFPTAGHFPQIADPERFGRLLWDFIGTPVTLAAAE